MLYPRRCTSYDGAGAPSLIQPGLRTTVTTRLERPPFRSAALIISLDSLFRHFFFDFPSRFPPIPLLVVSCCHDLLISEASLYRYPPAHILLALHWDHPISLGHPGRRGGRNTFTILFWRTLDVECIRTIPTSRSSSSKLAVSTLRLVIYLVIPYLFSPGQLQSSPAPGSSTFSFTR
ncbi:hypothetical protein FRC12_019624 [Ceratobasidium sp. 428]|nr:hypothetical protein FRC12_019624 [Ceratobasidium sp. 428]